MPRQLPLRELDLAVLLMLAERPSYGYELIGRFEALPASFQRPPSPSNLYYSLAKLRRLGLAQAKAESAKNAPDRAVHSATPQAYRLFRREIDLYIEQARAATDRHLSLYLKLQERLGFLRQVRQALSSI